MSAYLDNSATTKPCRECVDAVTEMLTSNFANPSSLHNPGINAMKAVIRARQIVADSLHAEKEEIYFTSGGTEANNLAVFGCVNINKRKGKRIVTTAIEHESIMRPIDRLEADGYEIVRLIPDRFGNISERQIFEAVNEQTILVSIMHINNEVGSVLPVAAARKAVAQAKSPAFIHFDCVQSYGKIPLRPDKLGADMITVSAHKIHGPKGIGALYIRKGAKTDPKNFARVFGGEQEKKIRPGTESSPLIAGFGAAVRALPDPARQHSKLVELNAYTRKKLSEIDGIIFNSSENTSPYIINIYIPTFMRSQTVVQELSANYGVSVSNGSACARGGKSHVLTAMNLPDERIDKSIRISFCANSTKEESDQLTEALREIINKYPRQKQCEKSRYGD